MTAYISCRSLIQIRLQIPRWRTKWRLCKASNSISYRLRRVNKGIARWRKQFARWRQRDETTFDWLVQHDDKAVVNCFGKTTAFARLWLYLKRLYFISSAIAYCISPYASFYAGLRCIVCEYAQKRSK